MKKIVIVSAAMGGAALIAFGASGTFASYQDTSQVKSSLTAGSIVLNVAGASENANLNVSGLKPGTTTPLHYAYWIQNGGSSDGTITAQVKVVDNENGCVGPEAKPAAGSTTNLDTTCTGVNAGELSYFVQVKGNVTGFSQANCKPVDNLTSPVPAMSLQDAAKAAALINKVAVPHGAGACVQFDVTLPDNPNINLAQGDSVDLTADFTLAQQ